MFPSLEWWQLNGPPWWGWVLLIVGPLALLWGLWVTLKLCQRPDTPAE